MTPPRGEGSTRDVLLCADVLGAFGVTPADVREQTPPRGSNSSTDEGRESAADRAGAGERAGVGRGEGDSGLELERALTAALRDARDRTATVRQIICRSSRAVDCSARYSTATLEDELVATFAAIDWSMTVDSLDGGDRLWIQTADSVGRSRQTMFEYPDTPLGRDNLPAVLATLNDEVLFGANARFVLLSDGADRWRAALVEADDLEGVRERYGDRVPVFDRPLLPEHGVEAYRSVSADAGERADPWPAWALERVNGDGDGGSGDGGNSRVDDRPTELIEEDEPTRGADAAVQAEVETETGSSEPTSLGSLVTDAGATSSARTGESADEPSDDETESVTESAIGEGNDLELAGGSPTVARVRERAVDEREARVGRSKPGSSSDRSLGSNSRSDYYSGSSPPASRDRDEPSRTSSENAHTARDGVTAGDAGSKPKTDAKPSTSTDDFGTLSGSVTTARVSNDSFGADAETPTEDDRYRALGAAIGTGKDVSVKGLLDDDEFLPELPAVEPTERRIEFEDEFDPGAVSKARARAEQSGFEWIDSGSLETTRISNGEHG